MSVILRIILHSAFLLDLQHIVPGPDECVRYEVSSSSFYPGLYIQLLSHGLLMSQYEWPRRILSHSNG